MRRIARSRLEESEVLFKARKYDGASYLCGYFVELALKARICAILKWPSFPETNNEFKPYGSFRTHDLDILLSLSGREQRIKAHLLNEWSAVATWDPDVRYKRIGTAGKAGVERMLVSAAAILKAL